jgi:hypothetical protein
MTRKTTSTPDFTPDFPNLMSRLMDIRLISLTAGAATVANMLAPGLGSAAIGAVLGALYGIWTLKPDRS